MKLNDKVKRKRTNLIRIYLNDEENDLLTSLCEEAGDISMSQFLRELIMEYKR